jgi:hypothetical protein
MKKKLNSRSVLTVITIWAIFSLLYGYTAYSKPFHVDEFFSWVYAERCTYSEILKLRDGGIGHPPLYHLAQKTVQTLIRPYNFINVRLANYFFGSLFVIALSLLLLRKKCHPLFIAAACLSATVIDHFIFSRMWGLVGLISVLLIASGERYCEDSRIKYLVGLFIFLLIGLYSDYNFVLLIPYIAIILLSDKKFFNKILFIGFSISIMLFVFLNIYKVIKKLSGGFYNLIYYLIHEIYQVIKETIALIFYFNYKELLFFSILILSFIIITTIFSKYQKENSNSFSINKFVKWTWLSLKDFLSGNADKKSINRRMILSIICALMILLVINPLMWREMLLTRFLFILYPLLLLVISNLYVSRLHIISIIMLLTTILYIPSNKVSDYYPPPAIKDIGTPVIFYDAFTYSTHYFKIDRGHNDIPLILDLTAYNAFCRICKMGTSEFDFNKYNEIHIVTDNHRINSLMPAGYFLAATKPNLSWFDQFLYSRLTPRDNTYFCVFTFKRLIKQ